jgi:uncharacterized protein (TIGR03790 family)
MQFSRYLIGFLLFLSMLAHGSVTPERVIIVANANEMESVALAEFYAQQRNIPAANIIALPLPSAETIPLSSFVNDIFNPLREALLTTDWIRGVPRNVKDRYGRDEALIVGHRIGYLVLCKGVPLRFENDAALLEYAPAEMDARLKFNRAAVDSELSLLAAPSRTMIFHLPNPFFEQQQPALNIQQAIVRVGRIDGPTYADARRLVTDAIKAEQTGLHGRVYVDARGPHANGNQWFTDAATQLQTAGFDVEIRHERDVLRDWEHRLDGIAFYLGWYRQDAYGAWLDPRLQTMPGAIGFHLHSFSATSLRVDNRWWVGPLIRRGVAASVGNVYEPYLDFTHRPNLFVEALLQGKQWGEAVYYSLPVLSWQNLAIGDPLYRPFGRELTAVVAEDDGAHLPYATIRRMNQLIGMDKPDAALRLGRDSFLRTPSLALALHIAKTEALNNDLTAARRALDFLDYMTRFETNQIMVAKEAADLLVSLEYGSEALQLYQKLLSQQNIPERMHNALLTDAATLAGQLGDRAQEVRWHSDLNRIKGNQTR